MDKKYVANQCKRKDKEEFLLELSIIFILTRSQKLSFTHQLYITAYNVTLIHLPLQEWDGSWSYIICLNIARLDPMKMDSLHEKNSHIMFDGW